MTDKIRAEAVLLLSCLASRRANDNSLTESSFYDFAEHLDTSNDGISLARQAYEAIPVTVQGFELECCEASLLVESGWEPGDEIELLPNALPVLDAAIEEDTYDE